MHLPKILNRRQVYIYGINDGMSYNLMDREFIFIPTHETCVTDSLSKKDMWCLWLPSSYYFSFINCLERNVWCIDKHAYSKVEHQIRECMKKINLMHCMYAVDTLMYGLPIQKSTGILLNQNMKEPYITLCVSRTKKNVTTSLFIKTTIKNPPKWTRENREENDLFADSDEYSPTKYITLYHSTKAYCKFVNNKTIFSLF